MEGLKVKLLEQLLAHLSDSQGGKLKSLLDDSKAPQEDPLAAIEGEQDDGVEKDPHGIKIESVELQKKPNPLSSSIEEEDKEKNPFAKGDLPSIDEHEGGDDSLTDDEIEELLKKYS